MIMRVFSGFLFALSYYITYQNILFWSGELDIIVLVMVVLLVALPFIWFSVANPLFCFADNLFNLNKSKSPLIESLINAGFGALSEPIVYSLMSANPIDSFIQVLFSTFVFLEFSSITAYIITNKLAEEYYEMQL